MGIESLTWQMALIVAVGLKKSEELKQTFSRLERIWEDYDVYQKNDENSVDPKLQKFLEEKSKK